MFNLRHSTTGAGALIICTTGVHAPNTILIIHLGAQDSRDKSDGQGALADQPSIRKWTRQSVAHYQLRLKILGSLPGVVQFLCFVCVDTPFMVDFGPRRSPAKLVCILL